MENFSRQRNSIVSFILSVLLWPAWIPRGQTPTNEIQRWHLPHWHCLPCSTMVYILLTSVAWPCLLDALPCNKGMGSVVLACAEIPLISRAGMPLPPPTSRSLTGEGGGIAHLIVWANKAWAQGWLRPCSHSAACNTIPFPLRSYWCLLCCILHHHKHDKLFTSDAVYSVLTCKACKCRGSPEKEAVHINIEEIDSNHFVFPA